MITSVMPRAGVDRFVEEQMFEEDLRSVLKMMRPNKRERLMGWKEYRTGGAHFRATISWDDDFDPADDRDALSVPHMADVLESILVGSARSDADLHPEVEFNLYREVVLEVLRRVEDARSASE